MRKDGRIVVVPGPHVVDRVVLLDALRAAVSCQVSDKEVTMIPGRRWKADLAWPDHKVALELQGGVFVGGHHVRGVGYEDDCQKILHATAAGWRVLPITWRMLARDLPEIAAALDLIIGRCEHERRE